MENIYRSYEIFVQTNTNNEIKTTQSQLKTQGTIDRYWWWVVYGKITKGIPSLKKQNLGKKTQEKYDKIKWKLHTYNRNRNYWIF